MIRTAEQGLAGLCGAVVAKRLGRPWCVHATLAAWAVVWAVQGAPAWAQLCAGDCDGNGSVTPAELVKGVQIALGNLSPDRCPASDVIADNEVTVDELVGAVDNLRLSCPTGVLAFDQSTLAMLSGGTEILTVTARDENGLKLDWGVESNASDIVSAVKKGSEIELTASSLGRTVITVTTQSELRPLRRSVPVRVYDPLVLDAGEILIKYVDVFECLPQSPSYREASFYHPVVPEGWRQLATFGVGPSGCPNINGHQWMIVVRENPERADRITPPLVAPHGYDRHEGIGYVISPNCWFETFWTPICPEGYVAMGSVVTADFTGERCFGYAHTPSLDDATCVREDLTVPGDTGDAFWTGWSVRTAAPANSNYQTTTAYLETGTFSQPAEAAVRNVLAFKLPMLLDTPYRTSLPHVTSFFQEDNEYAEPLLVKAVLVPFSMILHGEEYATKGVGWMVENSPFVRMERVARWNLEVFLFNDSSVVQNISRSITKGVSDETSTTISQTAGVSLTAETGVKFLGPGGKVSATVSYQFGYQTQHSVGQFTEEETTVSIDVPAHKAAAAWRAQSTIFVKLHEPQDGSFETIVEQSMFDSLAWVTDDYPD
jgi:hypothetical protein